MSWKNYTGYLAVANPNNPKDDSERSVYLMVTHNQSLAIGLKINKIQENNDLATVSQSLGIEYYKNDPIYIGGDGSPTKIHMVHSLDWRGLGTIPLTRDIGITQDISILVALADGDGPEYYKACAGYTQWSNGVFDLQLTPKIIKGEPYKWEMIPATIENLFEIEDEFLWEHCLQMSIIKKVKDFF